VSVWGVSTARDMILSGKSPYHHIQLKDFIQTIKAIYGLAPRTFNAPIYKLLGLKSLLPLPYLRFLNLLA
jgi:hypothetical protein